MLSQKSLSGGIAPQALSQPGTGAFGANGAGGVTVMVQNSPSGLQNVYTDPALHLNVLYSNLETPFKSNLSCPTGFTSVNNDCICPGSPSSVPYRQSVPLMTTNYMSTLWSPIEPNMFPQVSRVSQQLIADRSPCGPKCYANMDATPITSCSGSC